MHHILSPEEDGYSTTGDEFLSPEEIIARLQKTFKNVVVDKKAGKRNILGRIEHFEKVLASGTNKFWSKESIQNAIKRLASLLDDAYRITITDEKNPGNAYLTTVVMPNSKLFFGYSSDEQMAESALLLERCAKALGYEIEEGG